MNAVRIGKESRSVEGTLSLSIYFLVKMHVPTDKVTAFHGVQNELRACPAII